MAWRCVVHHVSGAEDAGEVGAGRGGFDLGVALVVPVELTGEQLGARVMADGDKQPLDGQLARGAGEGVAQDDAADSVGVLDLGDLAVPREADLRIGLGAGLHGLVLNALVLFNTRYTDAAVTQLRSDGFEVRDEDLARLSPFVRHHINVLGRYSFQLPDLPGGLRPLRDKTAVDEL